jgi:hypothetical protein
MHGYFVRAFPACHSPCPVHACPPAGLSTVAWSLSSGKEGVVGPRTCGDLLAAGLVSTVTHCTFTKRIEVPLFVDRIVSVGFCRASCLFLITYFPSQPVVSVCDVTGKLATPRLQYREIALCAFCWSVLVCFRLC